jgi:hypothetical protein
MRSGTSCCGKASRSKKSLRASEQDRPDVARRRAQWKRYQGRLDPRRLVFIDETWAKTNMTRTHGRCLRGKRLIADAPQGRWRTLTFLAALRADHETRVPPWKREVLLKADKVSVVFERIADGKIRVGTSSWDDPKVLLPNQVLAVASIGKQVGLVRVDKPVAYLDIDDTGLVGAGYGPVTP